jgi:hypothetical protein
MLQVVIFSVGSPAWPRDGAPRVAEAALISETDAAPRRKSRLEAVDMAPPI